MEFLAALLMAAPFYAVAAFAGDGLGKLAAAVVIYRMRQRQARALQTVPPPPARNL